ncbi:ATP4, subunit B of the stator stalk of mitochondrial F1F0 ATP synthase [Pisolithus croceorrhizus]|nr:ATP4, subunit B of the stator stalk of mitochondrial F1F0 ATP synthase [Pisolithus croceorrhizus]
MASRIALNTLKASARPRTVPAVARAVNGRTMSTSNPPPSERASEIINSLPSSPNLITKTSTAILGTGLLATAISQELYVARLFLLAYIAKLIREPYRDWANGHIERVKTALENSRAEHTQAVKDRINSVEQMKDVVSLTQGLFAISKKLSFSNKKVALASEVKAVLDSWVRYEQQLKESEQAELAKTIIAKVTSDLKDEKTQKEILA